MNRARKALMDRLETSGNEFVAYLAQLSEEDIRAVPAPTEWSIHQVVAHMRDTEQHVFLARTIRITQEAHPTVASFDQNAWQREHYSPDEPIKNIVREFRAARRKLVALLRKTTEKDWANWAGHPEYKKISLDWITMHNYHHTLEHVAQIGYAREKAVLAKVQEAK
ncbi:MAG: DinB family protein [Chloroflexi bacterium]|nr:DinB family protein [Chloroflexota bacterium]